MDVPSSQWGSRVVGKGLQKWLRIRDSAVVLMAIRMEHQTVVDLCVPINAKGPRAWI